MPQGGEKVSAEHQTQCAGIGTPSREAERGGTPTAQRHANGKMGYTIVSVPTAEGGRVDAVHKPQPP